MIEQPQSDDWLTPEQKQILGWLDRELAAVRRKRKQLQERSAAASAKGSAILRNHEQQKKLDRLEQAGVIARDILRDAYSREYNRRMRIEIQRQRRTPAFPREDRKP